MTSFTHHLRVRYGETDQMGVAHHGAYVTWLEEARIEMMRACGVSYRELEAQGVFMPVIDLQIRYRSSVRFDDQVACTTTVQLASPSRLIFSTRVQKDDQLCAEGVVTVAALDGKGRPVRVPAVVAAALAVV